MLGTLGQLVQWTNRLHSLVYVVRSPDVGIGPSFFSVFLRISIDVVRSVRGGLLQVLNNAKPYLEYCERTVLRLCLHGKLVDYEYFLKRTVSN